MRQWFLSLVVVFVLLGAFQFASARDASSAGAPPAADRVEASIAEALPGLAPVEAGGSQSAAPLAPQDRARAQDIRRALAAMEAAAAGADGSSAAPVLADREYPSGELVDRVGLGPELMKAVNDGLMPLVDECIDMAHERNPETVGLLAVGVQAVGDPDLGSVIESVEFSERNEVLEPELLECVRESAWSLVLPAPQQNARQVFELTISVEKPDAS